MTNYIDQFKAARRVGVPILAINSPDAGAAISFLAVASNGKEATEDNSDPPKVEWDVVRGTTGRGKAGEEWVRTNIPNPDPTRSNPVAFCSIIREKLTVGGVAFMHMGHRFMENASVIQAVWNVRDEFKQNSRMLVILTRGLRLPVELQDDVVVLDEDLPDAAKLTEIVHEIHKAAGQEHPNEKKTVKTIEALRGLSAFAAEQVTAMSMARDGLDMANLWKRKKQQVEQCPALKVLDDPEARFDRIGGCAVVKDFASRIMTGNGRPNALVFVDEIEKSLAGQGDTSGVSQDQLGVILAYMQDMKSTGMIFLGPPGAAKSAVAKAMGNEGGVPTLQLDLGGAKGSLVGQSEAQIRQALSVITAVSNGKAMWVATCNSIADLPPELRRRYTLGTYFFDLPTKEEREAIWDIYRTAYGIADSTKAFSDEGWTGAEIKQACEIAWRLGCTLDEASQFIVPVSKSAADKISDLRKQASGRFLSASYPGVFDMEAKRTSAPKGRRLSVE